MPPRAAFWRFAFQGSLMTQVKGAVEAKTQGTLHSLFPYCTEMRCNGFTTLVLCAGCKDKYWRHEAVNLGCNCLLIAVWWSGCAPGSLSERGGPTEPSAARLGCAHFRLSGRMVQQRLSAAIKGGQQLRHGGNPGGPERESLPYLSVHHKSLSPSSRLRTRPRPGPAGPDS